MISIVLKALGMAALAVVLFATGLYTGHLVDPAVHIKTVVRTHTVIVQHRVVQWRTRTRIVKVTPLPGAGPTSQPSQQAPSQVGNACVTVNGYFPGGEAGHTVMSGGQPFCVPDGASISGQGTQPQSSQPQSQVPAQPSVPPGQYSWPGGGTCNIPYDPTIPTPGVCLPAGSKAPMH